MDAARMSDGLPVLIKVVMRKQSRGKSEIGRLFSSEPLASNSRNHCVPLYEVLEPPGEKDKHRMLVMPLLRKFDSPPFDTVGEVVDFIAQVIEVRTIDRYFMPSRADGPSLGAALHARTQRGP